MYNHYVFLKKNCPLIFVETSCVVIPCSCKGKSTGNVVFMSLSFFRPIL